MIRFEKGSPSSDLLPLELLSKSSIHSNERLSKSSKEALNVLDYVHNLGNDDFRKELAKFINKYHNVKNKVEAKELCITPGASVAFSFITTLFFSTNDVVVVEDPTYFLAKDIFKDYKLQILTVPSDENGMDVDKLEQLVKKTKIQLVYVIPIFQNPSGSILSLERRKKLIQLSQDYDFKIIADEVYQSFYFEELPPNPLVDFDDSKTGGTVFSVGTFSKILCPGMRIGWIQVAKNSKLIKKLEDSGTLWSGGGMNSYTTSVIQSSMELGLLDEHLEKIKKEYSKRLNLLCENLQEINGKYIKFTKPKGGYFVWVEILENVDYEKFCGLGGIGFRFGSDFGDSGKRHIRLCFGYLKQEEITTGTSILIDNIKSSLL